MKISKNSKIFLTGASGFVGNHVVRLLIDNGYTNLTCLKRHDSNLSYLGHSYEIKCHWVTGDLLNLPLLEEQLADHEVIINLAAEVSFSTRNKKQLLQNAVSSTANLINAALYNGIKKVIHVSSVAAIGRRKKIDYIDESIFFSHSTYDTTYGLTKFLAEQEVWRGHAEGIDATVLCPSLILGSGNWQSSSIQLFEKIYKGLRYFPLGTTGWVNVEDVATAVLKSIEGDYTGERFIISADNHSYKEVFELIAASIGVKRPEKAITPTLGSIMWRLEKLKTRIYRTNPLFTKETFMSTSVNSFYDNSKSVEILKLQYQSIKDTIQSAGNIFLDTHQ